MSTYYELLNINYDASDVNIRKAYKNKIALYKNKILTIEDIQHIKQLKIALFILENTELRNNYNNILFNTNLKNDDSPPTQEPPSINALNNYDDSPPIQECPSINALNNYDDQYTVINPQEVYQSTQDTPNIYEEKNNIDVYNKQKRVNEKNVKLSNRIFDNNFNNNKIIVNTFKPIQTREDRKL
uniref:J domain-containing protein n=1 Tax=viral metagenome TaxID=1070528 RepID=A0A6C0HA06_9ZZZZ